MRSSLNDINSEQDNFEKGLIQEIFTAIDTTVFTTRGNSTNNNNIDSNAQQQQQQQQTPILLIEPAGLAAAHLRP